LIRRTLAKVLAFPSVLIVLGGCGSLGSMPSFPKFFSEDKDGLNQVDDLVGRIGKVHVECELAKQNLRSAFQKLTSITAPGFRGDAVIAHKELRQEIDLAEKRADLLEDRIDEMKDAAEPFFEEWIASLKGFTNASMRARSQTRLTETRQRYDAIVAAVEPAHASFVAYNERLGDIALFLEHDFNASPDLTADVEGLTRVGKEADAALDESLRAAEDYVQQAGLPAAPEPVAEGEAKE
jgi:hypothetical protein